MLRWETPQNIYILVTRLWYIMLSQPYDYAMLYAPVMLQKRGHYAERNAPKSHYAIQNTNIIRLSLYFFPDWNCQKAKPA